MIPILGHLIGKFKARASVRHSEFAGTVTAAIDPDEPGARDPYRGAPPDDLIIGTEPANMTGEQMREILAKFETLAGTHPSALDRVPAGTIAQIEEQEHAAMWRYLVCSECKTHGKFRTFRGAEGFASHLKNYHGAKDGDAVERLL